MRGSEHSRRGGKGGMMNWGEVLCWGKQCSARSAPARMAYCWRERVAAGWRGGCDSRRNFGHWEIQEALEGAVENSKAGWNISIFFVCNLELKLSIMLAVIENLVPWLPSSVTGVTAALQVEPIKPPQYLNPGNAENWARLLLPPKFYEHPHFMKHIPETFNPIPPHLKRFTKFCSSARWCWELVRRWIVLPVVSSSSCGQTAMHSFINLTVIPDFILDYNLALQILHLK